MGPGGERGLRSRRSGGRDGGERVPQHLADSGAQFDETLEIVDGETGVADVGNVAEDLQGRALVRVAVLLPVVEAVARVVVEIDKIKRKIVEVDVLVGGTASSPERGEQAARWRRRRVAPLSSRLAWSRGLGEVVGKAVALPEELESMLELVELEEEVGAEVLVGGRELARGVVELDALAVNVEEQAFEAAGAARRMLVAGAAQREAKQEIPEAVVPEATIDVGRGDVGVGEVGG
mmetsp:Transcript_8486/g.26473  ORF Transcript_8486/g.26473 Transcript_8486/m.26473 type:complete len:235 (-) Transcript_8486:885-1589(-)